MDINYNLIFIPTCKRFQVSGVSVRISEDRGQTTVCDEPFDVSSWLKNSGSNDSLRQAQGLSLSKAAESKTDGENWRMKHPNCPLFSVLCHLFADT